MKFGTELGLGPDHAHCVRCMGTRLPLHKRGTASPIFGPCGLGLIVAKQLDGVRCHLIWRYTGLGPIDIVLDGDPAPPSGGHSTPILAHACLLWRNGWMDQVIIKMPLSMEVALSSGDIMLDGTQPLSPKGHILPHNFSTCVLLPKGWMDQVCEGRQLPLCPHLYT